MLPRVMAALSNLERMVDGEWEAVDPQPDPIEMLNEGDRVDLKVTVLDKDDKATEPDEKLTISLATSGSADEGDYRLATHPLTIETTEMSAMTKLTISDDPDVNDETLTFDGTVAGVPTIGPAADPVELLSLEIVDETTLNIEPQGATDVEAAYDGGQSHRRRHRHVVDRGRRHSRSRRNHHAERPVQAGCRAAGPHPLKSPPVRTTRMS